MIQQAAFMGNQRMLKGGLHCHTTRSDGACTPEEVIRLHRENGYDFLAITDHRCYNFRNFAPDSGLTILPGFEFDNTFFTGDGFRTYHIVAVGPEKDAGNGFSQDEPIPSGTARDQAEMQRYLDMLHKKGNLTLYCHPEWSGTPARYFDRLQGNFAMEIWNSGCVMDNDMDKDAAYWDELLGQGIRIFGCATDDGHGRNQHCHGWVMVRAENNVSAILEALRQGAFYSSCGPVIHNFYVENDVAVLDCGPASLVRLISERHPTRIFRADSAPITHVEVPLKGDYRQYIRAAVTDEKGRTAWTNPIFLSAPRV